MHQNRTQIAVADAKLAVRLRVARDRRRRVIRKADEDLLRGEDDVDRARKALSVELAVLAHETHEIQRRQVARGVIDVHIFRTVRDQEAIDYV